MRSRLYLVIFGIVAGGFAVFIGQINQSVGRLGGQIAKNYQPVYSYTKSVRVGENQPAITIMRNDSFRLNTRWAFASPANLLPQNYVPHGLEVVKVPQAATTAAFKLEARTNNALSQLFVAAKQAGRPLIVSSAYRSYDDQVNTYNAYYVEYGAAYTTAHVALPRASEHQTGLAVDINSYSASCTLDATTCNLSDTDALWLAKNAPDYGFILRYPSGKRAITSVAYEPWHFRYVGSDARRLTDSGLTLDEFVDVANKQK